MGIDKQGTFKSADFFSVFFFFMIFMSFVQSGCFKCKINCMHVLFYEHIPAMYI